MINWQELHEHLETQEGEARTYGASFYKNVDGRFNEIINLWQTAGYDEVGTVEWLNFYPGKHFDQCIVDSFAEQVGLECAKAWVSCVRPGRYAPYHWDIDDHEEEYLVKGSLVRYTTVISKPQLGQVFIVEDHVIHNQPQGYTYKWPNYRAWHGGGNCSFKPKYIFNFLGIQK